MKPKQSEPEIKAVVCAVRDAYEICVLTNHESLVSVRVGGETYYYADNGVRHSRCPLHKFRVPAEKLNAAGAYTVETEWMIKRLPYRSLRRPPVSRTFRFTPVPDEGPLRIYHVSDSHGQKAASVNAAGFFGETPDLLILNGDIASHTHTPKAAILPIEISWGVTKGERPCVITRGNHDLRGKCAENLSLYYPTDHGRFYYPVYFPGLELLVLECGEDKVDECAEYGGTICCHAYRKEETAFLREYCDQKQKEPDNGDIRVVLSHIPFMHTDYDPARGVHEFDIEQELYGEWVRLMNDVYRPRFGLFGHIHQVKLIEGAGKFNEKGFNRPLILGGKPDHAHKSVVGTALVLDREKEEMTVRFSDSAHNVLEEHAVSLHF